MSIERFDTDTEQSSEMERLIRLANRIPNSDVRKGVIKIVSQYADKWEWLPTSTTGKYHKHEVLLVDHIENCMIVAERMKEEFKLSNRDMSKLYAAVMLHDIGRAEQIHLVEASIPSPTSDPKTEYMTTHKTLGNTYIVKKGSHPMLSAKIIIDANFFDCTDIAMAAATHMSHWGEFRRHPQPSNRLQDLVCVVDFLASRYDFRSWEK